MSAGTSASGPITPANACQVPVNTIGTPESCTYAVAVKNRTTELKYYVLDAHLLISNEMNSEIQDISTFMSSRALNIRAVSVLDETRSCGPDSPVWVPSLFFVGTRYNGLWLRAYSEFVFLEKAGCTVR